MARKPTTKTDLYKLKAHTITIVGGGMSARDILSRLLDEINDGNLKRDCKIEIITADDRLGKGLAWDARNLRPWHLINTYVPKHRITEYKEDARSDRALAESLYKSDIDCGELTREFYGNNSEKHLDRQLSYLKGLGVDVEVITNTTVEDIKETKDGYTLITEKGEKRKSDFVVIATGHWQQTKPARPHPGIFESPWPASRLEQEIDSNQPIAVMGTSLSAVDAALTLAHKAGTFKKQRGKLVFTPNQDAQNFRIDMYSHHGELPAVLGYPDQYSRRPLPSVFPRDDNGRITLDDAYDVFRKDFLKLLGEMHTIPSYLKPIDEILRRSADIRTAVENFHKYYNRDDATERLGAQIKNAQDSLTIEEPLLWQNYLRKIATTVEDKVFNFMDGADRKYFMEEVRPIFAKLAYGMVLSNAEQMHALMESGCLQVHALGKDYSLGPAHEGKKKLPGAEIRYVDKEGAEQQVHYNAVVKAYGDDLHRLKDSSPLMKKLFKSGLVKTLDTPYKDQEAGQAQYELEEDDPSLPKLTVIRNGKYCHSCGGIEVSPAFVAIPDDSRAPNAKERIYTLGPNVTNHLPLLHGFGAINAASKEIVANIVHEISLERSSQKRTMQKPEELVVAFPVPLLGMVAVTKSGTPAQQMEQIRTFVATQTEYPVDDIRVETFDQLPPKLQSLIQAEHPDVRL